jgi:3-dehydrotetronate 4-kinase
MSRPVFCAVADDDTGATDLAGMLSEEGLRTVLVVDGDPERWSAGYDAVILGIGSRALPAKEAYSRTREAARKLRSLAPRVIEIKYCSTFDSTTEGNIGPSLDAAMDELAERFTVALPALPVNGRTTFMGHHFVHRQLLSESPMRDHPLTPMRNPDLVSHLQSQTTRRVGLAAYPVTRAKLDSLRSEGVEIAILDCVSDADLKDVCEAIAHLPLISGSSAPAMKLSAIWRREGWWTPSGRAIRRAHSGGRGFLVVAGSCSEATRRQNAWFEGQGAESVVLDPVALALGAPLPPIPAGRDCLIRIASSAADIERVGKWAREQGCSPAEAGLRIAYGLARLASRAVEDSPPAGLIVAGGETASAICRTLRLGALEVGRNIEPGVPLCIPLGGLGAPLVLKSGNFGSAGFYGNAIGAIKKLQGD